MFGPRFRVFLMEKSLKMGNRENISYPDPVFSCRRGLDNCLFCIAPGLSKLLYLFYHKKKSEMIFSTVSVVKGCSFVSYVVINWIDG